MESPRFPERSNCKGLGLAELEPWAPTPPVRTAWAGGAVLLMAGLEGTVSSLGAGTRQAEGHPGR